MAQVTARAERARRPEVMDGREIVRYGMALMALRLDDPEGWAGLDTRAHVKRTLDSVLGRSDDPLLQSVVVPISERKLRKTLAEKVALFEPGPRADPAEHR